MAFGSIVYENHTVKGVKTDNKAFIKENTAAVMAIDQSVDGFELLLRSKDAIIANPAAINAKVNAKDTIKSTQMNHRGTPNELKYRELMTAERKKYEDGMN